MIITKTPVRLSLGGGGSDLPSFYKKHRSGYILSTAINKYVFCLVRSNFEVGVRFTGYNKKEIVRYVEDLSNPIVKAVLKFLDYKDDVEIVTMSDVRTNCGLGTSSSFTVGLIHALRLHRGDKVDKLQLAKDAITIERDILKESGGIQDQYSAAIGGILSMHIDSEGNVDPVRIFISEDASNAFLNRCHIYDTKSQRFSSDVQAATIKRITEGNDEFLALRDLMNLGMKLKDILSSGDINSFGLILDQHWKLKKSYADPQSWNKFDDIYKKAMLNGAIGGKLIGAGGGGYFMFVIGNDQGSDEFEKFMKIEGLERTHFDFEDVGSNVLFNG